MIVASERDYKNAYVKLGEERVQKGTKGFVQISRIRRLKSKSASDQANLDLKDYEKFWFPRRDENWSNIPIKKVWSRKERKAIYIALVTEILNHLAPASTFNPWLVWMKLKEKEAAQLLAEQQAVSDSSTAGTGKGGTVTLSKIEILRQKNIQQTSEDDQIAEITRIRNSKDSITTLIRTLSTQRAREILLIEILKKAVKDRNLVEIYDILWAIENFELTKVDAPQPKKPSDIIPSARRDSSLVYDSYKNVENLIEEARKIRNKEKDIIQFQLNEMSGRLPPLSPYMFDFKLDAWQIRALQFIDAGKSLVICAPTSSGKTVLSTYVALISKHKAAVAAAASEQIKTITNGVSKVKVNSSSTAGDGNDMTGTGDDDEDEEGIVDVFDNDDEEENDDDDDDEDNDDDEDDAKDNGINDITPSLIKSDREKRIQFRKVNYDGTQRVLFVVPSEPLVWQVAAYFTKLLKEEGDEETKVAIVTSQMIYFPPKKFNVMPQIVVGTPMALESALTKCRGLVGRLETIGKAQGDLLPGGFDHFDWAIFDEVHAIDGEEGDALQRLIRSMNCKFLALSATVGNAEELLGWLERVKGDQLVGVETLTVLPEEASFYGTGINTTATIASAISGGSATALTGASGAAGAKGGKAGKKGSSATIKSTAAAGAGVTAFETVYMTVHIKRINDPAAAVFTIPSVSNQSTVSELKMKLWRLLPMDEREPEPNQLCIASNGIRLSDDSITLDAAGISTSSSSSSSAMSVHLELIAYHVQVCRTVDNQDITVKYASPLCTVTALRQRIIQSWPALTAEALQVLMLVPLHSEAVTTTSVMSVTKAISVGDTIIHVTPGVSVNKGTLLAIRQVSAENKEMIEIVSVAHPKSIEETAIQTYPFMKAFPADVSTCALYMSKDLHMNQATLDSYDLFATTSSGTTTTITSTTTTVTTGSAIAYPPIVQVRTLVNLLSHQGRFINLQRFLWSNSKLQPMSPLAAVESIDHLKQGILDNSSLSFTSKDSYRLWIEMEKVYPVNAITKYDPHTFFTITNRITLQSTKDYEDLLKSGLHELAIKYPLETKELLYKFSIEDRCDKGIDLCELSLVLNKEQMLPALAFHRNAFESIALFKQLLAGIEWRQKKDVPLYYKESQDEKDKMKKAADQQQKDQGKNAKKKEEEEQSGEMDTMQDFTVDLYEPHPKYRFSKGSVMTADEFTDLSDEMERFDGFPAREAVAMQQQGRGKNEAVLTHTLMRGLRRGVALYIDEVSSPAYRRAVQRLSSQGKLGVVISDDSLAFGVNMPFRTCIFCGEMENRLTPLMAQQMSGRAGRRGLDTQGNLVYAGARASFIRGLMIGQVARITGEHFPPRYETLFLQGMLSTRHVGWSRIETLSGQSLHEYATGSSIVAVPSSEASTPPSTGPYGLTYSKQVMADLGLITLDAESGSWVPSEEWELLGMVWELRNNVRESVSLGRLLPQLSEAVEKKTIELLKQMQVGGRGKPAASGKEYEKDRKDEKDKNAKYVSFFFSILLQLIDRQPYDSTTTNNNLPPLHEHPQFNSDRPLEQQLFQTWSKKFEQDQNSIPTHLSYLKSPVPPGTPLDSTLFCCILDKEFVYTLSEEKKQEIKGRIWHVGTTLQKMLNTLWPNNHYCSTMANCLRTCFKHLYYLNTELTRGQINFDDVSAALVEAKIDKEIAASEGGFPMPVTAKAWKDTDACDEVVYKGVSYCEALERVVHRLKEWKQQTPAETINNQILSDTLARTVGVFSVLKVDKDLSLVRVCALEFKESALPLAIFYSSHAQQSPQHLISLLFWVCYKLLPTLLPKFPVYLKALLDYDKQDLLEESAVQQWASDTAAVNLTSLPLGHEINEEVIEEVKKSKTMMAFLKWLEASAAADDDEDEEEDD